MNVGYQLRGYIVNPLSIVRIREVACSARKVLGLGSKPVDLGTFLESLSAFGITIDVVDDEDMPGFSLHSEACCIPETATIYLTEKTYRKACENDPRTRFTIFHELGHLILGHRREFHRANLGGEVKAYQDSEWQADQFAAEAIMALDVIVQNQLFGIEKIRNWFGVSELAAKIRYEQLVKHRTI